MSAEASSHEASPNILVKIGTGQFEINIRIPGAHAAMFEGVTRADWDSRSSVRIGEAAGAPAWWCADTRSGTLSILIGEDDESWDIAATLPLETLDAVIAEVARTQQQPRRHGSRPLRR